MRSDKSRRWDHEKKYIGIEGRDNLDSLGCGGKTVQQFIENDSKRVQVYPSVVTDITPLFRSAYRERVCEGPGGAKGASSPARGNEGLPVKWTYAEYSAVPQT